MAKKKSNFFIQNAIKHPGALTRKAKAAGMSVSAYSAHPPKGISTVTKRQIALAHTLAGLRGHARKKKG